MNSSYQINKGINTPIEFKGLKAQYIWWLAAGLVGLLIAFALMYFVGINTFICLVLTLAAGTGLFTWIYGMSNRYGEHGMLKKMAARQIPGIIKVNSRMIFINL